MLSPRHLARSLRNLIATVKPRPTSPPHLLSTAGFQALDPSQPLEEETIPWYDPNDFYYPVRIGHVFQSRYQVIGKLGYGGYSTVWLCRDLILRPKAIPVKRELSVFKHINNLPKSKHVGRSYICIALDQFELMANSHSTDDMPSESFQCFVHQPTLATTLFAFRKIFPRQQFPEEPLKPVLKHVLLALHFLHSEAKVVHTDIQEKNILLRLNNTSVLEAFEEAERTSPTARKVVGDRTVYQSREIAISPREYGPPTLCDFGEARFGHLMYMDFVQPDQYRAPEVLLGIPWNEKVDIWSVGVMIWDMFEGTHMFKTIGGPEKEHRSLYHLAHMVSLLGLPPIDLLKRSEMQEPWEYFDAQGNWIGATSLPDDSLEQSELNLKGEDKTQFLRFVRKMVTWKPEDRCCAKELLDDPWLNKSP